MRAFRCFNDRYIDGVPRSKSSTSDFEPSTTCFLSTDDSCQFNWNMRFKVILAICEALHFLHIELNRTVSHLPLTPENIFLDHNMVPKLPDIGLSDLFDGLSPEGVEYGPEIR